MIYNWGGDGSIAVAGSPAATHNCRNLTSAEFQAPLSHHSGVAVGHVQDGVVDGGSLRSGLDLDRHRAWGDMVLGFQRVWG